MGCLLNKENGVWGEGAIKMKLLLETANKEIEKSAEKVDRTPDLMIFSHTLSQLSYLGFWFLPSNMAHDNTSSIWLFDIVNGIR